MDNIFFSIVCPMYNASATIRRTIISILNQSFSNWELVLIDDGSADSTKEHCKSFLDTRIHYYYQDNKGPSVARDNGTKKCSGDYIIFLDSDDYLQENALAILNKYICDYNPEIVFFQENYEIDGKISTHSLTEIDKIELLDTNKKIINRCYLHKNWGFGQCGGCFQAELFKMQTIRKTDIKYRYCEDILNGYFLLKQATRVLLIPDIIYTYVKNSNSITHSLNGSDIFGQFVIFDYVFSDILTQNGIEKERIKYSFDGGLAGALVKYIKQGAKKDDYNTYKSRIKIIRTSKLFVDYLFEYHFDSRATMLNMKLLKYRCIFLLYLINRI